jgi:hypothetical protein
MFLVYNLALEFNLLHLLVNMLIYTHGDHNALEDRQHYLWNFQKRMGDSESLDKTYLWLLLKRKFGTKHVVHYPSH